jgi:serine/threonine protein kinase
MIAAAAAVAEPAPLAKGARLAEGYEVIAHLSRSRALDVYDVWSTARCCRCVAKLLRPDKADDARSRSRLRLEGRLLLRLSHPHFVRAYELVREPALTLILETLSGATLSFLIATHQRIPPKDLSVLGKQLVSALGYLHAHGYLHLDLKPGNVVAQAGVAKLFDLSIARKPGRGHKGVGTRQYLSPEQASGGELTFATDVWGLGALLFNAATGRPPFAHFEGKRFEQLERRAARLAGTPGLPQALAEAIDFCLEPEPAARPTLVALARALEAG